MGRACCVVFLAGPAWDERTVVFLAGPAGVELAGIPAWAQLWFSWQAQHCPAERVLVFLAGPAAWAEHAVVFLAGPALPFLAGTALPGRARCAIPTQAQHGPSALWHCGIPAEGLEHCISADSDAPRTPLYSLAGNGVRQEPARRHRDRARADQHGHGGDCHHHGLRYTLCRGKLGVRNHGGILQHVRIWQRRDDGCARLG